MTPRRERAPGADGFTLLEVLAAVMIFAVVVTMLIGSSTETVHRARLSATRLEASALADRELARIEAALTQRTTPPEDSEETVEDLFVVRVWSEPALEDLGGGGGPSAGAPSESAIQALATGSAGASALGPLIAMAAPGIEAFLLRYEIRVEWIDDSGPDQIRRTTYAFDWEGAGEALPELFKGAGGDAALGDPAGLDPENTEDLMKQLQNAGGRAE